MKIDILSVRAPRWADEERTAIDVQIKTNHLIGEYPFTSSPTDCEEHGREIFARCLAGEFGEIAGCQLPEMRMETSAVDVQNTRPNRWPEVESFLEEANLENSRGSVRAVILVWGCMIESILERVILEELKVQKLSKGKLERSLGLRKGKYGDFSTKISAVRNLKILSDTDCDSLDCVRIIRNKAAHVWQFNFNNNDLKLILLQNYEFLRVEYNSFVAPTEDIEILTRLVFSGSCAILISKLVNPNKSSA